MPVFDDTPVNTMRKLSEVVSGMDIAAGPNGIKPTLSAGLERSISSMGAGTWLDQFVPHVQAGLRGDGLFAYGEPCGIYFGRA